MSAISEYEGSKILDFFKHNPDNEKKLISIAKTITKNTLTHLSINGETHTRSRNKNFIISDNFLFRCL